MVDERLNNQLELAGDRLLNLFVPKATAQAEPPKWCSTRFVSCGWPKVWYFDYVKGVSCGCW